MAAHSILSLTTEEENQWVLQISHFLHRTDLHTAIESPPFIFRLPDSVRHGNHQAYLPRRIALGPLHHFRPELYKMEVFKLHAAKKVRDELHLSEFHKLADFHLVPLELRIRACFDQFLEMGSEALAWIMLIDGLFLLRLLVHFSTENEKFRDRMLPLPNSDDPDCLFIRTLKKFSALEEKFQCLMLPNSLNENIVSHYEILSDVVKLENQIPILVLKEILPRNLRVKLCSFLYTFCAGVSPFELPAYPPEMIQVEEVSPFSDVPFPDFSQILDHSHHLLHFIYFVILITPTYFFKVPPCKNISQTVTIFQKLLSISSSVLNIAFLQQLKEAIDLIRRLLELLGMVKKSSSAQETSPIIPSASQLQKVNVKFKRTKTGILEARFHKHSATLVLPVISVNAVSEVLLRNLVAFEAMAKIKPSCFAEYVALMNGLIASSKDVKILKEAKILFSDVESDEEVVKLFNGGGVSADQKLHCEEEGIYGEIQRMYEKGLKGMAEEINGYYESCWKVKAKRFVRKYGGSAMVIMAVLVIFFLVFLVIVRLVCSLFFSCPKILKNSVAEDVISFKYV